MKIPTLPFTVTDWSQVPRPTHPGETGEALWRTLNIGDLRVRMVEYSPGYLADHWCDRGHVLYVLEGELDTELRDGRTFKLKPGMSYQVSDFGDAAHRSSTEDGREAVHRGLRFCRVGKAKRARHSRHQVADQMVGTLRFDATLRLHAFFSTETKNPSVPVRRGVISQPSADLSAAFSKSSALSQSTLAVSFGG